MIKSCLVTLAILSLFLLSGPRDAGAQAPAAGGYTVGVVNVMQAIADSKQGKAANSKLQTKYDALKKDLEKKSSDLEKKNEDLRRQASTLTQDALDKRNQDLMKEVEDFKVQAQKSTDEMQKAYQDAMAPIGQKAETIIASIAREKGFSLVLESGSGGVLFVEPQYEITAEVTKRLDSGK
ncbi:MAG: OmpH family outer membrane protein [Deltaproteobacteria bacterium]|jgi:outer membrane protein|nr:OmpH family outer membrane protein [Deltaproteobacteria bacterium]